MAANLIEFAQELKQQVGIEQVVADYVPNLHRRGKSYKALCPFHEEKTPSFHVHPEFGFYHCFGCHARGDAIKFVQEFEKVDFRLAVSTIAKRFGIPMPEFRGGRSREEQDKELLRRQTLLAVCKLAEEFYVNQLWNHPKGSVVRDYMKQRGLTPEQLREYRIGFAPPGYESFLQEARGHGYKDETTAEAGQASRRERGGYIDRFRNRIMFPIADQGGDIVGFGGRLLDGDGPKYLNSPDTPLFHKGKLLYGLTAAREALREQNRAILLEGYMDWIALHSLGIRNVLAGLGTALGPEQARLLKRMTSETVLIYDGDDAGRKAMFRAAELLLAQDVAVRAAVLPPDQDPDSYIREKGPKAMAEFLDQAPPALEWFFEDALSSGTGASPEGKLRIFEAVAPLVRAIRNPILKEGYVNQIASRLGLEPSTVKKSLGRGSRSAQSRGIPKTETEGGADWTPPNRLECSLLNRILCNIERWELIEGLQAELFSESVLSAIFVKVYAKAEEINRGGDIPEDWYSICNSEQEISALDYILSLDSVHAGGDLDPENIDRSPAGIETELKEMVARIRRKWSKRKRSEERRHLRASGAPSEQERQRLATVHALGQPIIRETEHIFGDKRAG